METNTDIKIYTKLTQVDLKNDLVFKFKHDVFTRDKFAQTFIEKAFGTSLIACFITYYSDSDRRYPSKTEFNIGCMDMVLYFESGSITRLTNSEWGAIVIEKINKLELIRIINK